MLFPELLYLELLGPFLIRVVAGAIWIALAQWHYTNWAELQHTLAKHIPAATPALWSLIALEGAIGSTLMLGLYTQAAAGAGAALAFLFSGHASLVRSLTPYSPALYALLCAVCISLIFTGAGAFAVDMPL